jgi:hypothetical protein
MEENDGFASVVSVAFFCLMETGIRCRLNPRGVAGFTKLSGKQDRKTKTPRITLISRNTL